MTERELRDQFANTCLAAAMSGATNLGDIPQERRKEMFVDVAAICYDMADAMLLVRARE